MIDALIGGRLRGAATMRTSANGNPFAVWRMAATDKNGVSVLCSCIAFNESAIRAVQALGDGDALTVAGETAINEWQDRQSGATKTGLDVTVYQVMTAYHAGRKRKAQGSGQDE